MEQAIRREVQGTERRLTLVEPSIEDRRVRMLARLYDTQAVPLYRFIYQQVGNRTDAEALTTRVFQAAKQQLDPARSQDAQVRWLFKLAQTVVTAHWQGQSPAGEDAVLAAPADAVLPRRPTPAHLDRLSPLHRQVLTVRLVNGCSLQETATALGCTPDEVKTRQYEALQAAQHLT
jgi:RNA polymerase sigma-70 factor (ECF subfamily)